MSDDRIAELEIRTAFQDDTIAALNDALVSQQRQLDQLKREIVELREQLMSGHGDTQPTQQEETPPHY